MSKKDINKQEDQKSSPEINMMKDNMHLFSFSLLKSKSKITLSKTYNSFHIDFSKSKDKDYSDYMYNKKNKDSNQKKNNRKISLIDDDNTSSLKTLNIEVPSSDFLSQEKFKNEFMKEYDNSFASYCGINKKQFTDIYVKNRYIPILDEFGDINISIKYITDLLKTYSSNVKAGRKIIKRNRIKKIFKTLRKKNEKMKKNRLLFEVSKNESNKKINIKEYPKDIKDEKATIIKSIKQEIDNNNKIEEKKENYNSINNINNLKNKVLSKYGNISIPNKSHNISQDPKIQSFLNKSAIRGINTSSLGLGGQMNMNMTKSLLGNTNFIYPCNTLSNEVNKQHINLNLNNNPPTSLGINISAIKQMSPSNNNNNYFNFSNSILQNYNYANTMNTNTIPNNNILNNNTNSLGYNLLSNQLINSPNSNLLISPRIFGNNLLSPPILGHSNISTPRLSPGLNNNLLPEIFNYNNIPNFFLGNNSPIPLQNTMTNNMINNNILNGRINNNKNMMENNNINMNNINNNMNIMSNNMNNNINNNVNNNDGKLMRKNISKNLKINTHMNN